MIVKEAFKVEYLSQINMSVLMRRIKRELAYIKAEGNKVVTAPHREHL